MSETATPRLEDHLKAKGAWSDGRETPGAERAGGYRVLAERSGLEPGAFATEVAIFHRLPRASLDAMRAGSPLIERFSLRFLREFAVYPYEDRSGEVRFAIADASDTAVLRTMELTLGRNATREVAAFDEVEAALRDAAGEALGSAGAEEAFGAAELRQSTEDEDLDGLRDLASGAPVVRAVAELFERAVELRATDIHVEPLRGALQVRLRVDGLLRPVPPPPGDMARAIVSRIKILAGLNIAERRLPQDGRARIKVGSAELDLRVATMPTAHGEAAILRVLERNKRLLDLGRLGLSARDHRVIAHHLENPHGLIVVTGPTGSGKTTTLAAALGRLNTPARKILTIEDPIEYEVAGVNQTQVKPAIGLTFATALRAFLRQDPDVIMVGEMRDAETAKIGIQASLTGHLVLTTLHTNTAAAAITRLIDMGVESFLLASTLHCIVGQRLVRVLCPDCRRMARFDQAMLDREPRFAALGLSHGELVGEPVGCARCAGTGYRGRQAVFEVLEVTEPLRRLVTTAADDLAIENRARADGMTRLVEDGLVKCRAGLTSLDEILRVAASR